MPVSPAPALLTLPVSPHPASLSHHPCTKPLDAHLFLSQAWAGRVEEGVSDGGWSLSQVLSASDCSPAHPPKAMRHCFDPPHTTWAQRQCGKQRRDPEHTANETEGCVLHPGIQRQAQATSLASMLGEGVPGWRQPTGSPNLHCPPDGWAHGLSQELLRDPLHGPLGTHSRTCSPAGSVGGLGGRCVAGDQSFTSFHASQSPALEGEPGA